MRNFKNIYQNHNEVLNDAFDRLVAQIHIKKQKNNLKTFVVCGSEPGVGTTTIAINLAIAMAEAGWKTLLVDADFRKLGKDKHLTDTDENGIIEFLEGGSTLNEITTPTNYDFLSYIANGKDDRNAINSVCSAGMQEFMNMVAGRFDYVILDTPSLSSSIDAAVLSSLADATVLITSQLNRYTKKSIKEAKKQLDNAGANILGVVVNNVEQQEYRRVMKDYDYFKKEKYYRNKAHYTGSSTEDD